MAPHVSTFEPWALPATLETGIPAGTEDGDKVLALQVATDILFQLSGRQWPGRRIDTIRPECGPGCYELELPWAPILEIVEIVIEDEILDPSEYRVDDYTTLVRLRDADGVRRSWPTFQDMTRNSGERTWSVTERHGASPPPGGVVACTALARQFLFAWSADKETNAQCKLPKRITTISRQGVTLAVLDPFTLFEDGKTGIAEADLWLGSLRFGAKRRAPAVVDVAGTPGTQWNRTRSGRRGFRSVQPPGS